MCEGASNVKFERLLHLEKQDLEILSIEEGIHIAWSDEHAKNAWWQRVEITHADANRTERTQWRLLKHPAEIASISGPIVTSSS
jgi:hypothetical protein